MSFKHLLSHSGKHIDDIVTYKIHMHRNENITIPICKLGVTLFGNFLRCMIDSSRSAYDFGSWVVLSTLKNIVLALRTWLMA